jgi:hypothetical protein
VLIGDIVQYEELHRRYGPHVSQRIKRELTTAEFNHVKLDDLPEWLEERAEAAHAEYHSLLNNPLVSSAEGAISTGEACRRWRAAEDLSYLIAVADDVGANARVS